MAFSNEKDFEDAMVALLPELFWEKDVLENYDEDQLLRNWANILYDNNRCEKRLNNFPLTPSEMQQILDQVKKARTPYKLNSFINGGSIQIVRDNQDDTAHYKKTVSLTIYNRKEIAAGSSRYQIVRQPRFHTKSKILNDRRGDLLLLINGMPVIHIELKRSGIPVSQACSQIQKYASEGCFTGIFSLIQVFVAMSPEEARYFANPGPEGKFNPQLFFEWADVNNEPINDWYKFTCDLLNIPMAHQLIGFYTVADGGDKTLKVLRSYQYQAANAISDAVSEAVWEATDLGENQRGGHIWHTTGSGKTMTSFKSAQLINSSGDADKVVFLVDRIELGTQSLAEYQGYASEKESVQDTEDTFELVAKLESKNPSDTLIVTSIQKMGNIKKDGEYAASVKRLQSKRIVFIVDECHRSTFGERMMIIKDAFPLALFFGFTGTPIQEENPKEKSTTATVFGRELHRYLISDGIRDRNVLAFDLYKAPTFKDQDIREKVALREAKAKDVEEALADPEKKRVFLNIMQKLPMAGRTATSDINYKGIEDYVPTVQYQSKEHQSQVVKEILDKWTIFSVDGKFHAIFATSSISEAIEYYRLFKEEIKAQNKGLKVTAVFDTNIDNDDVKKSVNKETGLEEIVVDYNEMFEKSYSVSNFAAMKRDISLRLAHKEGYKFIENNPEKTLDLLIVVDQMLTGYDSKWVNVLYLDKVLRYENIIQAFSRTNRLNGPDKPFGIIKYFRYPHTMEQLIKEAVALYSGNKPLALFVQKLPQNLNGINRCYGSINDLFTEAGIKNFSRLPETIAAISEFVRLFNQLNSHLRAAKVQGFKWDKLSYDFETENPDQKQVVKVLLDQITYQTLVMRYKEIEKSNKPKETIPYDLKGHITSINTNKIDSEYINERFKKYLRVSKQTNVTEDEKEKIRIELHKIFASLPQEEQKIANFFMHEIQRGDFVYVEGKSFYDYVSDYITNRDNRRIHDLVLAIGVDEGMLKDLFAARPTEEDIDKFARYTRLIATRDDQKAKAYFEAIENRKILDREIYVKVNKLLREFLLEGGFDIKKPKNHIEAIGNNPEDDSQQT